MNNSNKVFLNEIAELLEIKPINLTENLALNTLESWDSLAIIKIIIIVDQHYNKIINFENLLQCKTTIDLVSLIFP